MMRDHRAHTALRSEYSLFQRVVRVRRLAYYGLEYYLGTHDVLGQAHGYYLAICGEELDNPRAVARKLWAARKALAMDVLRAQELTL